MVDGMSASEGGGRDGCGGGLLLGLCGPVARLWPVACVPVAWAQSSRPVGTVSVGPSCDPVPLWEDLNYSRHLWENCISRLPWVKSRSATHRKTLLDVPTCGHFSVWQYHNSEKIILQSGATWRN